MTRIRARRVGVVFGCAAALLLCAAQPAAAHAGGLRPLAYRSTVTGIVPPVPGLQATMVNNGTELELRNGSDSVVTVLAAAAGPAPRVVLPGQTVRYRDPRTGWPADAERPGSPVPDRATATDGGTRRDWQVPILAGSGQATITGELRWPEAPEPLWWSALILALAAGGHLLGRSRWWRPGLAVAAVLVTAANIGHITGSVLAVTGADFVPLFLGASGVGLVCWPLAAIAVIAAVRGRPATAFAAAVAGAALVVAGIPDYDSFRYAQLPFAGPADLDRLALAVTLGGGARLATGGFSAMRRMVGETSAEVR